MLRVENSDDGSVARIVVGNSDKDMAAEHHLVGWDIPGYSDIVKISGQRACELNISPVSYGVVVL